MKLCLRSSHGPRWPRSGVRVGIGASQHDPVDPRPEALQDLPFGRPSPRVILDGVVQQRPDPLLLIAPVLQHDRRHAQQVGQEGDAAALPPLPAVDLAGVEQGFGELGAEGGAEVVGHGSGEREDGKGDGEPRTGKRGNYPGLPENQVPP